VTTYDVYRESRVVDDDGVEVIPDMGPVLRATDGRSAAVIPLPDLSELSVQRAKRIADRRLAQ
jgi:hypothetical protein